MDAERTENGGDETSEESSRNVNPEELTKFGTFKIAPDEIDTSDE